MIKLLTLALAIAALAAFGCSKREDAQSSTKTTATASSHEGHDHADDDHAGHDHADDETSTTSTVHAPEGALPGSWEDWCAEHAVPESQCTRCNPTLIPAFKSVNDWCEAHGLPHSQCLLCDPTLKIERPPKPSGT